MQYVLKPPDWDAKLASDLQPGHVYLSDSLDPAGDDAPWQVVRESWRSLGAVCIVHADDPPWAMPRVFGTRDGVFVAVYGRLEG